MKQANTVKTHAFQQFELTKNLINNLQQYELTPTAKLVLLYLSSCYNPSKADMYPKIKTISLKIGISERSTMRAISELQQEGLILKECNYTNHYKFTSKITTQQPRNEKILSVDNMSSETRQNDISKRDNLSPLYIEQIKEQKNNPKEKDLFYLNRYAEEKGVNNKKAYIQAIINNGNYQNIIKKYKLEEQQERKRQEKQKESEERKKQAEQDRLNASSPLEFTEKQAKNYVYSLSAELKNTYFAKELMKKYNFTI